MKLATERALYHRSGAVKQCPFGGAAGLALLFNTHLAAADRAFEGWAPTVRLLLESGALVFVTGGGPRK